MTHVDLDSQPEVVRQFVLNMVASDGVVLQSAGQAVACVVPPPQSWKDGHGNTEEWTPEKNQRRCELLDKKYDHSLSPAEEAELALLQDTMYGYVDKVAPLPLDEARRLHQELLEKAAKAEETNST